MFLMKITENEFEEIQNAEKENYNIVLSKSHIVNVGCLFIMKIETIFIFLRNWSCLNLAYQKK